MSTKEIVLDVNENRYETHVEVTATLADVLREKLGLTGTKIMCNEGECGACTVLMDGEPVLSCMTLAMDAQDKKIQTIEGLADPGTGELHPLQESFVVNSGMQCGVCTPGMIMTSKALIDEKGELSENDVREALSGNLCRCGNYLRITECVLEASVKLGEKGDKDVR
ncbi:MAG: (2Fe-2S)-binding protein [Deltaproteobacteria bacterium]|nr:(2Fe-2S)-binding protein [Deltaproteobacteria bacterium]